MRYVELDVPGAFPAICSSPTSCDSALFHFFQADGQAAKNVLAALPGADPARRGRVIVLGAHYDHLGRSSPPALVPPGEPGRLPGADDNASGTAALLELARRFAAEAAPVPVLFAHFDAEELGLLGSQQFLAESPVPHDSIALMINLDMVGRLGGGALLVEVTPPAGFLGPVIDSVAAAMGVSLQHSGLTRDRSDHSSFARRGIPAVALSTGLHVDYHRSTDTPDKVDLVGIGRVVDLVEALVRTMAKL
jgi:Zn-dependent M28 family amino/carboxypeptidase